MKPLVSRPVLLAILAAATVGLFIASGIEGEPGISDTGVYQRYGELITAGNLPYRDFAVEYPPGALLPFVLPALVSDTHDGYDAAFLVLMVLALVSASTLIVLSLEALHASRARMAFSVGAFLVGTAVLGPFVLTRFDLYAATFTLAAVCAILFRRERLGSALLGLAIATKIYPAVLLPLLVARLWRRDGPAVAMRGLALTVGTALAVFLPFLIAAPDGVARSVWRQVGRPLQIESLGSGVLLALHHVAGMPLGWASGAGSQNLTGTVAGVASGATTLVGLAALAFVWARYARGDTVSAARFAQYAAAAVVAFVAFGKVASPQFLIWLLVLVVLVPGRRGLAASGLLLAACALTRLWFPRTYWDLVKEFDPTASWLVLARDVLLVAVLAILIATFTAREGKPSESR